MIHITSLKPLVVLAMLLTFTNIYSQTDLTAAQKGWMYRVVNKTNTINQNCGSCFTLHHDSIDLINHQTGFFDYDLVQLYIINNPDSLEVNAGCLKNQSNGVLIELSTKLAIYELNEQLKLIIKQNIIPLDDPAINRLTQPVYNNLPKTLSQKKRSKKTTHIVQIVLDPSLPIFKKVELLDGFKLSAADEKILMNSWQKGLVDHLTFRSHYFFNTIKGDANSLFELKMLATGEGSGTAGLLNENEVNPIDSSLNWYGKAAGLFTYQFAIKQNKLVTLNQTSTQLVIPKNKDVSVHVSLWGLNSSIKPMVVIGHQNKTYHLYVPRLLTPDSTVGEGLTQYDQIARIKEVLVDKKLMVLRADGGLESIVEKEYLLKDAIESDIKLNELFIDSLRKEKIVNEVLVATKKALIDTYITNLNNKEKRIDELNKKLKIEYDEIDKGMDRISAMKAVLGDNIQSYTTADNQLYSFADGAMFDYAMQDFIIKKQPVESTVKITLISPHFTIQGVNQDEVQLIASIADATVIEKVTEVLETPNYQPINLICRHHKDQFKSTITIDSLLKVAKLYPSAHRVKLTFAIDTSYLQQNIKPSRYEKMRYTSVQYQLAVDTLKIHIQAGCDPTPTQLSAIDAKSRSLMHIKKTSIDNNKYLAILRSLSLGELICTDLPNCDVDFSPLQKLISKDELDLLRKIASQQ